MLLAWLHIYIYIYDIVYGLKLFPVLIINSKILDNITIVGRKCRVKLIRFTDNTISAKNLKRLSLPIHVHVHYYSTCMLTVFLLLDMYICIHVHSHQQVLNFALFMVKHNFANMSLLAQKTIGNKQDKATSIIIISKCGKFTALCDSLLFLCCVHSVSFCWLNQQIYSINDKAISDHYHCPVQLFVTAHFLLVTIYPNGQ